MSTRTSRTMMGSAIANLRAAGHGPLIAPRKAAQACAVVHQLARAGHELGRWPTQAEYASYWKIGLRTAERDWARFREAFPDEPTPDRFARHLAAELGRRVADDESAWTTQELAPPLSG